MWLCMLSHVKHCQSRLSELAADAEQWDAVSQWLSPDDVTSEIYVESLDARDRWKRPTAWTETMAKSLLSAASHPEMLGRIGRYDVERLIGSGGMGVVFKAYDTELNRPVAVKLLAPYLAGNGAARKRFAREARAAAAVVDDHVVPIHNVETESEHPFLVMKYIAGGSLQQRLDREGPLEVCEVLRIGMQTAKGLAAAHAQGLIHRDVKPSNILLDEGVERALLTDFGLARAEDDACLTRSGFHPGTPHYMSPEQVRGDTIDGRSDLFGLGCVLYALCTGHPPFRAETSYAVLRRITDTEPRAIRETNPDVPLWLEQIVMKLLAKSADNRFDSAAEVAELLESCLAHVQQPTDVLLPSCLISELKSKPLFSFSRRSLGAIAMFTAIGPSVLAVLLSAMSVAPDIAGHWAGEDWGDVELTQKQPGEFEGTFAIGQQADDRTQASVGRRDVGTLNLKWSRLERRFSGTWQIDDSAKGRISLRLADGEIRGAMTTSRGEKGHLGTPRLGDFEWTRSVRASAGERSHPVPVVTEWAPPQNPPGTFYAIPGQAMGPPVPLSDVVSAFNQRNSSHPIGKDQPRLTVDEVVASLRLETNDGGTLNPTELRELRDISEKRLVHDGWHIVVATAIEGKNGEGFLGWSIRLVLQRRDSNDRKHTHIIREQLIRQIDERPLWRQFGVTPSPVTPLTARVLEWVGLHLGPITNESFRGKNVLAKYAGGLDVTFVRSDDGPAGRAGIHEVDIVVGLQGHKLVNLEQLDVAVRDAVTRIEQGDADALQFDVLRNGETVRINVPIPAKLFSSAATQSSSESGIVRATTSDSGKVIELRGRREDVDNLSQAIQKRTAQQPPAESEKSTREDVDNLSQAIQKRTAQQPPAESEKSTSGGNVTARVIATDSGNVVELRGKREDVNDVRETIEKRQAS